MIPEQFQEIKYKFRTAHRDDYYNALEKGNTSGLFFTSKVNSTLAAFAVGFHLDARKKVNADGAPVNHANLVNFPDDARETIIYLMLNRFPDLKTADELWTIVEEYAEYGICILYQSIVVDNEDDIVIDDILGKK